jgi:hypothetical protein
MKYVYIIFSLSLLGGYYSCVEFDVLQSNIREGKISKDSARRAFKRLIPEVHQYFVDNSGVFMPQEEWVFPVEGYSSNSIGAKGKGYSTGGFDYFDGNKSTAHPAHDIFIRDKDQDDVDDNTGALVNVRSVSSGVVLSTVKDWESSSELRGGKSVVIYDPESKGIFAYAHLSVVFANVGDILMAGEVIGTVGRTGKNAAMLRSPTHLHISYMKIAENGLPYPSNIYSALLSSKRQGHQ